MHSTPTVSTSPYDFSDLPPELITKIGSSLSNSGLKIASLVCKTWWEALRPVKEGMKYLTWGKQFKHGRGGFGANVENALKMFLKAAEFGSTKAMADAGLIHWQRGEQDKAFALCQKDAEAGDRNAHCNLGISYLRVKPPNPKQPVKWLHLAQYQLAVCLCQGHGVGCNMKQAARWYLRAAECGYVRAMYNVSLCYKYGEGLEKSLDRARKWMKWEADLGHSKAQYEHGLTLFSEGNITEMVTAFMYLELANRGGVGAALHIKDVIHEQLSSTSRYKAMCLVDNWRALPSIPCHFEA